MTERRSRGPAIGGWALGAALVVGCLAGCGGRQAEEVVGTTVEESGVPTAGPASDPGAETAAATAPPEARRIPIQVAYDEPTELTFAGGECHVLELELEPDRFVGVEIEQRGVDVYTILEAPGDGESLFFDSPTAARGREEAAFLTERAGIHRLEVCSSGSDREMRSYGLRASSPRQPSSADRSLARGFRHYSAGERAAERGEFATALAAFKEALLDFRAAGADYPPGWAEVQIGLMSRRLGDLEAATTHLRESARIHRELNDPRQEAYALSHLGTVLSDRLLLEEAREAHRLSVVAAEAANDRGLLADSLKNLALLHQDLGETLEAVETHHRRRVLAVAMGKLETEWHALSRIGKVYRRSGDDERARPIFEEALAFARHHRLPTEIVESLVDLGRVHVDREEPGEALRYFLEALRQMDPSSRDLELASVFNNVGRSYRRLGEREKALEFFRRALEALPDEGWDARLVEGMIFVNIASLHILEGDLKAAQDPSERALAVYRTVGRPIHTISALKCLAEVRAAQGHLEEAGSYLAELLDIVEERRNRSALRDLRATFLEDKYFYYEFYVEVLLRLHERQPGRGWAERAFEVAERAKARLLLDELAGTEADILAAADPELVALQKRVELQMSQLEARLLEESSTDRNQAIRRRLHELEIEHDLATARIFADYPAWSALLESEPISLEEVQRELLADGESQLVSFLLGEEQGFAWIVGRDSVEVEVLPGFKRIDRLARDAAQRLRKSDQPHLTIQAELTAEALSRELLAPVVPHLRAEKLLLVKDGALHYVSFAALPLPGGGEGPGGSELLIDRFELVDLPSASAAVALRRRGLPAAFGLEDVAILGDPVFQAKDERLSGPGHRAIPRKASTGRHGSDLARVTRGLGLGELRRLEGTLEEVRRISALVPPDRRLVALGFDANQELLLGGRLGRYRILHLAGHGLAHPDLTALVLSLFDAQGRPVDGIVSPYELFGARLSAELVVLSACSTGLGDEVRGEGLLGLSRGFLYAGASQVLASLWDVDDRATAELMERFYTAHLRDGEAPARALRKAQLSLRREPRWAAPHYWAGFVLQGDGR